MDFISDIDWEEDNFTLVYLSLGQSSDDIRTIEGNGINNLDHPDLRSLFTTDLI